MSCMAIAVVGSNDWVACGLVVAVCNKEN